MLGWKLPVFIALMLVAVGALYVQWRWLRSPQAYRAMMRLAACYFVAGSILGAWTLHLITSNPSPVPTKNPAPSSVTLKSNPAALPSTFIAPFDLGPLHYDPAHAVLP